MSKISDHKSRLEELSLVAALRLGGGREAFGRLVERHQAAVRGYLLYLTRGDRARADDLAQEAFLKAFTALGQFRGLSFKSWVMAIAYRTFLDDCRSQRATTSLDDRGTVVVVPEGGPLHDPALACLDGQERHLILLSAIEELSHGQIAEMTELPLGTVKTTLLRAKNKLREHLKHEER